MTTPQSTKPHPRWALWFRTTTPNLSRLCVIKTPYFGVYWHHIHTPDLARDPHNHPWPFISWVLRGGYTEKRYLFSRAVSTRQTWRRWSWHRMGVEQAHRILSVQPYTWTLVFVGRRRDDWGFFTEDGFVPHKEYTALKSRL